MFSKLAIDLNFAGFRAINAGFESSAGAPASPFIGRVYYDSVLGSWRVYDGAAWVNKATDSLLLNGQNAAYYLARVNQTGTQTAATISDLAAVVQAYRLDQFAAPIASVPMGSQKMVNMADGVNPQDSATMNNVTLATANAAAGIDAKASVRMVLPANDSLSGLAIRDGVTPIAGDRVLAPVQTAGATNGVYIASAAAWTRALDADQNSEMTPGAFWYVEEGTLGAATQWRIQNTGSVVLGTTSLIINQFGSAINYTASLGVVKVGNDFRAQAVVSGGISVVAAGIQVDRTLVPFKAAVNIGTGAATSIAFTHNLGTLDVTVSIHEIATGEMVGCKTVITDLNTVTFTFGVAPAASALRAVVTG